MYCGVDLGGTKIEIIVLSQANDVLFRQRIATPQGNYAKTLEAIFFLFRQAEAEVGHLSALGVGIPGAISLKTRRIKNANSVCLIGQDLKGDLEQQLRRPVRLANDANCFALSEAIDGAGQVGQTVFGVIIGTGCGGGLIVDGQPLNGCNSIAGEWGHNPLPWMTDDDQALSCYCGKKGCLETFVSGPGFSKHFESWFSLSMTPQQMVAVSQHTDNPFYEQANQAIERYCEWLAKGLASVINLFDPDVIVLGGGMSNIEVLYQRVPDLWQDWVFSDSINTQLHKAQWGDSSGVRGAAWLVKDIC